MVHGVLMESTPKTSAGHRTIGLDEATFAVLKEHRRRQEVEKSLCPTGFWQRDGHIFTDDIGRPLVPDNVTKEFTRAVRRASLPRVRLHDTRHSNATALLRAGVDVKVVAGRLGHSSTAVTQNVYQHRVEQLDRAAAEKVAGMLFGAGRSYSGLGRRPQAEQEGAHHVGGHPALFLGHRVVEVDLPLPEPEVGTGLVPHAVRRHYRDPAPTDGVPDLAFVDGERLAPGPAQVALDHSRKTASTLTLHVHDLRQPALRDNSVTVPGNSGGRFPSKPPLTWTYLARSEGFEPLLIRSQ